MAKGPTEPTRWIGSQRWNRLGALSAVVEFVVVGVGGIRGCVRASAALPLAFAAALVAGPAMGGEPPRAPIPRVETGMHTGLITQVAVDATRRQLLTTSYDKTLRIWQLPSGRPVATLRPPIGPGAEGQLYALALSPNDRIAAVSGWTGWAWDERACIYFFDLESHALVARLAGLPTMVTYMQFTPDGKRLVVALARGEGIRVYRSHDFALLAEDRDYSDNAIGVSFDGRGRIATSAADGFVRLYDADLQRLAKRETGVGAQPMATRFSPDGRSLAVGHLDAPGVALLSPDDLSLERHLDLSSVAGQQGLQRIAWSRDGEQLFAYGNFEGTGPPPIHVFEGRGRGERRTLRPSEREVTALAALPGGGFALAARDPVIHAFDGEGRALFSRSVAIADFRGAQLEVSADAERVVFPTGRARLEFDLRRRAVLPAPAEPAAAPPSPGVDLGDPKRPRFRGHVLALEPHEIAHAGAVDPDGRHALVGSGFGLSRWRADGTLLWRRELDEDVLALGLAPERGLAVAAMGDGSLRWFELADGATRLTLFAAPDGAEWIAWRPDGTYASSERGDRSIGWQLNRGAAEAADFHRAVQFERVLYRPDRVAAALGDAPAPGAVPALREIAPPRIHLARAGERDGAALLRIRAESTGLPMRDFAVYVNNIPVTPGDARAVADTEELGFERDVALHLPERESRVRVEIFNGRAMGLAETWVETERPTPLGRGVLHLLAIGVDRFDGLDADQQLQFAAHDARELARLFEEAPADSLPFREVRVRVVADGDGPAPTHANVIAALDHFRSARAEDTVLLFLASHGISDASGSYLFLPRDATRADIAAVLGGQTLEPGSLVPWHVFFDALRRAAGRRLLIVDTCQAQKIEGTLDLHSLAKRSAASAFALLAASKGDELSQEYPLGGHGLFTYGLLRALEGRSDRDRDRRVSLEEAFAYVGEFVRENRNELFGTQTPQLRSPPELRAMGLR